LSFRVLEPNVKAVILAAGKGTRMAHLTRERPKPMVPVLGRPLIDWILERISAAGIDDFILVTGHLGETLEEHVAAGAGARTVRFVRQNEPNGTGEAVHLCREAVGDSPFLLSFGDILAPKGHYARLVNGFREAPSDLLMTVNRVEDPWRGAAVYVDAGHRVTRLVEKPEKGTSHTHWNNGGIFLFSPVVFEYTARLSPSPRGEYELTDAVTAMIEEGRSARAIPLEGTRCNLTGPEDVAAIEEILRSQGERDHR
jgi:dTDP-glucose pyrophosphorylase